MLRDPHGRMLVLGVAIAAAANVLLATRPDLVAAIPLGPPVLMIAGVVGLVLVCHNGMALAARRRAGAIRRALDGGRAGEHPRTSGGGSRNAGRG